MLRTENPLMFGGEFRLRSLQLAIFAFVLRNQLDGKLCHFYFILRAFFASPILKFSIVFLVSLTFLVLYFWTFLVRFSGQPTPSCQKT